MSEEVTFKVVEFPPFDSERGNRLLLVKDNWDDFGYKTTFGLYRLFPEKEPLNIGVVKIAQRSKYGGDSDAEDHRTELPTRFAELSEDYFSLGQGPEFYENLVNFGQNFAHDVLAALRDIAFARENLGEDLNSDVTTKSLLRTVNFQNVENQYRRIIFGGDKLEAFSFTYTFPEENGTLSESPVIAFEVEPKSLPPSNVHAVIGSNGCGKTWLLESLSLLLLDEKTQYRGKLCSGNANLKYPGFASLIAVSFSAFDRFSVSQREDNEKNRIPFGYVGLRAKGPRWQLKAENSPTAKGLEDLTTDFGKVFIEVMQDHLKDEWINAIEVLNNTLSFNGDLWLELSKDDR